MTMQIYKFAPYLKSVIWGGDKIKALKGIDTDQQCIGESWELSDVPGHVSVVTNGADRGLDLSQIMDKHGTALMGTKCQGLKTFPLLIKIIDAKADLSVQVHPDDTLARKRHGCMGKTEMWYVMDAEPGAKIYAGLSESITPDDYSRLAAEGRIMDVVAEHVSHPGDVYFLPAGRIHAIGAGNLLAEIQQTSDITYRVYDYDRRDAQGQPRQLHTELAKDAIDYKVYPRYEGFDGPLEPGAIVQCPYFNTYKIDLSGQAHVPCSARSFTIVMCLRGHSVLTTDDDSAALNAGETALVPACAASLMVEGEGIILYVNI